MPGDCAGGAEPGTTALWLPAARLGGPFAQFRRTGSTQR